MIYVSSVAKIPGRRTSRADLHLHSTRSDGAYSPSQLVDLARRSSLAAVALTDHDTLSGLAEAQAAAGTSLEVVPGVEITSEYHTRELHLLGYFVRPDNIPLVTTLGRLCVHRNQRFWRMVDRLRGLGVSLADEEVRACAVTESLGRRHLADLLVRTHRAGSVREAFSRYLADLSLVPKLRLPVREAIALVVGAGGVAAWAHPSYDCTRKTLSELRLLGLQAVEVEYAGMRPSRIHELRCWARELGLAVTGGSDCHGPEPLHRSVGSCSISSAELDELRGMARSPWPASRVVVVPPCAALVPAEE